jgi:hypothetical protein
MELEADDFGTTFHNQCKAKVVSRGQYEYHQSCEEERSFVEFHAT